MFARQVSIGIALASPDCSDARNLFIRADIALYSTKASAYSECCFYDPYMSATAAVHGEREQA